mgnify:CR=1 FL=1
MNLTKESATFTPGPWQIEDCTPGESTGLRFEVGTKDSVIARTTDGWKEAHANARLIAACPEMYEMCKLLEECMETIDGKDGYDASWELAKVREVLAKVEGGEG